MRHFVRHTAGLLALTGWLIAHHAGARCGAIALDVQIRSDAATDVDGGKGHVGADAGDASDVASASGPA